MGKRTERCCEMPSVVPSIFLDDFFSGFKTLFQK